jgi:hypothetical protein
MWRGLLSHEYGTHLPVLEAVCLLSNPKTVLEYGGGLYSTKFFLSLQIKELWTVETDSFWAAEIASGDERHQIVAAPPSRTPDLILIDDGFSLEERVGTIEKVSAGRPDALVVIHDFEQPDYRNAAMFDETAVFNGLSPWTGVMWNEGSRHGGEWVHRLASTP